MIETSDIRRGIIVAEGDLIACQTWIEGVFVREFTHSPAGSLLPNGRRVVMDLINIFRFDAHDRLIEEHVRTDNRSPLRQLGRGRAITPGAFRRKDSSLSRQPPPPVSKSGRSRRDRARPRMAHRRCGGHT